MRGKLERRAWRRVVIEGEGIVVGSGQVWERCACEFKIAER